MPSTSGSTSSGASSAGERRSSYGVGSDSPQTYLVVAYQSHPQSIGGIGDAEAAREWDAHVSLASAFGFDLPSRPLHEGFGGSVQ